MNINNISKVMVSETNTPAAAIMSPQIIAANEATKTNEASKTSGLKLDATDTKELVKELNEYMDDLQTNIGFSFREESNHQVVVEIKNRKTQELVRQIPSEELLIIRDKMVELSGFIFDQSV